LTFLDAYTPLYDGKDVYGDLTSYPHFSEHYVDRSIGLPYTDACLAQAFNFDITNWQPITSFDKNDFGHQWPRYWYEESVTTPGFTYGYTFSLEGSGKKTSELGGLYSQYTNDEQCSPKILPLNCWS